MFRAESAHVAAGLVRVLGDFDVAEDALQEAFRAALDRWATDGVPDQPGAWVRAVAHRRGIDLLRARRRRRQDELRDDHADEEDRFAMLDKILDSSLADDRLRLVFTCCHPALARDAQIALTLRTLGGLTTAEIARAFLVPEATLAQRIVRAKRKVVDAGIPFRLPADAELPNRLPAVLAVVYLIFNEGYAASSGDAAIRIDLCAEAIRLARLLVELMPDEPEVLGLLALLLLHDSRRDARADVSGEVVLLEDQDRTRWDAAAIASGCELVERALRLRRPGPYQIQAAIAAVHAEAPTAAATDWHQIVALYDELSCRAPSPVIALNRAAAIAMRDGPEAGLAAIDAVAAGGALDDYVWLHATRAELLRRSGRAADARAALERALALVGNRADERLLRTRLERL